MHVILHEQTYQELKSDEINASYNVPLLNSCIVSDSKAIVTNSTENINPCKLVF